MINAMRGYKLPKIQHLYCGFVLSSIQMKPNQAHANMLWFGVYPNLNIAEAHKIDELEIQISMQK